MKLLAQTSLTTSASPQAVYALWADVNNWHTFDDGIEWAKLNGPFAEGATYTIKPKGGPKVKATVVTDQPPTRFIDVSHLWGAKLRFDHTITTTEGISTVEIINTIDGPLAWLWAKILGKDQQADLERSVQKLVATAEAE